MLKILSETEMPDGSLLLQMEMSDDVKNAMVQRGIIACLEEQIKYQEENIACTVSHAVFDNIANNLTKGN